MGNELIRICGIGILCAVATLLLREKSRELASLLRVGGLVLMTGLLLVFLHEPLKEIQDMLSSSALSSYITILLKAIGIAILCATCGNICRDCGEGRVADCVEIAGNVLILSLCIPIVRDILEQALSLMTLG